MLRINTNKQEVEYKGLFFPFNTLKKTLRNTFPEERFFRFCIHKTFNKHTGQIDRKYAWDSVFQDLHDNGLLTPVLDQIIYQENLN